MHIWHAETKQAVPLTLSRMHGVRRLLVLARDLHLKSALTIASSSAPSTRDWPHTHRLTRRWPGTRLSLNEKSCGHYMKSCQDTKRQLCEASQHHTTKNTWTTYNAHTYVNTYTAVTRADDLFFSSACVRHGRRCHWRHHRARLETSIK